MGKKETRTVITVCTGDKCKDRKAGKVRKRLNTLVEERGLSDTVKVKKCACLGKCKQGPVLTVKPGKKTFEQVKPNHADAVLGQLG